MLDKNEFLEFFNIVCKEAINIKTDFKEITDLDALITESGIDSLDFITVFIYIGDIFEISDEDFNKHPLLEDKKVPSFNNLIAIIQDVGKNKDVDIKNALEAL